MRSAICIHCDDVRQEAGGKMSLMGIYQSDLLVPEQQTVLPKLCFVITALTTPDRPFSNLAVRVAAKDKIVLAQELPRDVLDQINKNIAANADPEDPSSRIAIVINLAVAPFVIDGACTIKTTVIADEEEIPAGRLKIGFAASWPQ